MYPFVFLIPSNALSMRYVNLPFSTPCSKTNLTFRNRTSYIQDGRTATLQMLHFIYFFFNKYKYRVF